MSWFGCSNDGDDCCTNLIHRGYCAMYLAYDISVFRDEVMTKFPLVPLKQDLKVQMSAHRATTPARRQSVQASVSLSLSVLGQGHMFVNLDQRMILTHDPNARPDREKARHITGALFSCPTCRRVGLSSNLGQHSEGT